jgi:hypothetical protein
VLPVERLHSVLLFLFPVGLAELQEALPVVELVALILAISPGLEEQVARRLVELLLGERNTFPPKAMVPVEMELSAHLVLVAGLVAGGSMVTVETEEPTAPEYHLAVRALLLLRILGPVEGLAELAI